jgi:hypothetical protein
LPILLGTCHCERSEESAFVCGWIDAWRKEQIPHRLKSVRDDKNEWPRTAHLKVRPFNPSIDFFRTSKSYPAIL